jgi:hypothetical protein
LRQGCLIAFGIAVIVLAIIGGNTVNDNLKQQFTPVRRT